MLLIAFILYNLSFLGFAVAVAGKKWSNRDPAVHLRRWNRRAITLAILGLACHIGFFATRWVSAGRIPIANMFEFMTALAMMIAAAYIIIFIIYRTALLGMFAMPLAIILLGYAAVFPKEIQPLIPALQSVWLYIHVTIAALGEAFFAIGFAAGFMYLVRTMDYSGRFEDRFLPKAGIEVTIFSILVVIGFVLVTYSFDAAGYKTTFNFDVQQQDDAGNVVESVKTIEYTLPPIVKPLAEGNFDLKKLNTVIWSFLSGVVLYGLLLLVLRKPAGASVQRVMGNIDADDLDEISYRAIAIGYPLFALGGLIFAMIWAHEAWGRFWDWDPKETWALIVFLFYTIYLHLRLSRGWQGTKSSWLSVIGFLVVMFTLVGVNLIIAGLHSYAGV